MAEVVVNKITGDVIEGYNQKDLSLIPAFEAVSQFTPSTDNIEFSIYNEQGVIEYINYNYTNYQVTLNYNSKNNSVSTVTVDPEKDLITQGYDQGNYTVYYNFLRNQISSSQSNPYFVTQISSDRTELRLSNNNLTNDQLVQEINNFINELNDSPYFEDFRLNFGNNNIYIANNILLDTSNESQYTVLVKLYEPVPPQIEIKDSLTIALQTADEVSFKVEFENKVIPPPQPKKIGGPNFNLNLSDKANNDTSYKSANDLLTATLTSSYNQILNILNEKGINVNVDYSDFNNFVYFGSAEQRVRNFYYKVGLIEGYDSEISALDSLTTSEISSSLVILQNKKQKIIKNFDGYERYQYYSSGSSDIYPKSDSTNPYTLFGTGSAEALAWLEDQATNSGSEYDIESVDRLANSLPEYVREDTRNDQFLLFMDMIGQHFDNIWAYTKDVSNRFDGDNRLTYGISKDLVKDAIVSLGVNIYGNNHSDFDLYSALTSVNADGTTGLPSGSGEINTETIDIADPSPKEDIIKGVYKRIFHNLPYIVKQKGSYEGLRTLINTFGIPGGMLRIAEFGGWNKESGYYKYYEQVDNLAFTRGQLVVEGMSAKAGSPFEGDLANISFRFKYISSSLPDNGDSLTVGDFGNNMTLEYTGGGETGSYSGSIASSSLNVYKGDLAMGSCTITAPFFNGEWWTVAINHAGGTGGVRVGSNGHNAGDGFQPVYILNTTSGTPGIGGNTSTLYGNGTTAGTGNARNTFAFQEIRYYTDSIGEDLFKALVMNPFTQGISSGNVVSDVYDNLFFRAPLGSDGVELTPNTSYTSVHPRASGYSATFIKNSFTAGSNYRTGPLGASATMVPNKEFVYFNEPESGVKNRISQQIAPRTNSSLITGNTLSKLSSIEQKNLDSTYSYLPNVDYLEVGFSPQNEINDDISETFGDFISLGELIGDPEQFEPNYGGKNNNNYPSLLQSASVYFEKYNRSYNWQDYIRLIKYFDNSLFKMVKDFSPAKSNVATGVIIKQHLLERSRASVVSSSLEDLTYSGSIGPELVWDSTTDGTGSIHKLKEGTIGNFSGGGGGVFNAVNGLEYYWDSASFDHLGNIVSGSKIYSGSITSITPTAFVSQSWKEIIQTQTGEQPIVRNTQQEFYNGELGGTNVEVTDGNLNPIAGTNLDGTNVEIFRTYRNFSSTYNGLIKYFSNIDNMFGSFNIRNAYSPATYVKDTIYFNTEVGLGVNIMLIGRNASPNSQLGDYSANYDSLFGTLKSGDTFTMTFLNNGGLSPQPINVPYTFTIGSIIQYPNYWYVTLDNSTSQPQPNSYYLNANVSPQNTGQALGSGQVIIRATIFNEANQQLLAEYNPQENNAINPRTSNVFMDVDYTSFGSGSLVPINIEQIITGSATKAPIQDSNYSSTGFTNARYNGTKASSLGFNIPYSK